MYKKIVGMIENGENVFITGGAGTGKSYTLQKLRRKYPGQLPATSHGRG